jgi:hypothetical protein
MNEVAHACIARSSGQLAGDFEIDPVQMLDIASGRPDAIDDAFCIDKSSVGKRSVVINDRLARMAGGAPDDIGGSIAEKGGECPCNAAASSHNQNRGILSRHGAAL